MTLIWSPRRWTWQRALLLFAPSFPLAMGTRPSLMTQECSAGSHNAKGADICLAKWCTLLCTLFVQSTTLPPPSNTTNPSLPPSTIFFFYLPFHFFLEKGQKDSNKSGTVLEIVRSRLSPFASVITTAQWERTIVQRQRWMMKHGADFRYELQPPSLWGNVVLTAVSEAARSLQSSPRKKNKRLIKKWPLIPQS